ncbi:MAG: DUF3008 family protein [Rikenellaceae bacterium]|nr:DUF3008 family protein [Rikenellaceae bacterium]
MGAALAYKRGEEEQVSDRVKKAAESMTEKELEDYASKPDKKKKTKD